jgi:hypothetical protein
MRYIAASFLVAALLVCIPAEASAKFHYTHRLSIEAELVNNWTLQDTGVCAPAGTGSLRFQLATTRSTRFRPEGRRVAGGRLNLVVPNFGGTVAMGIRKAAGTVTAVNNTEPNPDPADAPFNLCPKDDKSGCGTHKAKGALYVAGRTYTQLKARGYLDRGGFDCRTGVFNDWSRIGYNSGGFDRKGNLLLGPTSARKMHSHKQTVLTGTDHVVTHTPRPGGGVMVEEVTRRITVTITKL